ncbi:HupE/UreJ family protein [Brevirhabdus sp.]|uniref:HupE/UreJ family protein n=1 Tax=Brevirhabdus sp. TaxID=2004514 RepID=UPI004059743A
MAITFVLVTLGTALPAAAHEVRPAIGDFTVGAEQVDLSIRLTIEAILADVDLSEITDTNDSENASDYDSLRALPGKEIEARVARRWDRIAPGFKAVVEGVALPAQLVAVSVPDPGDTSLARDSHLTLRFDLPPGDGAVELGWIAAYGPLVLRQSGPEETAFTGYLTGGKLTPPIPRTGSAKKPAWGVFLDYIGIGYIHIVPLGLDHILFVLGLFLLSARMRPLLIQITSFTLAHTVTLALGVLGIVTLPPAIVEPLIAASIVYVAIENILMKELSPWRPLVVFGFGLLHGLGFAAVLGEIGLNPAQFVLGLVGFNIGVELGQLSVVAVAFLAVGLWFRNKPWYRSRITVPASLVIAAIAAFWVVQRTVL